MTPIQPTAITPPPRPAPTPAAAPIQPAPNPQGHRENGTDDDRRRDERARAVQSSTLYGPTGRRETSIPGSTVSVIA
jgi:hypothetical protein